MTDNLDGLIVNLGAFEIEIDVTAPIKAQTDMFPFKHSNHLYVKRSNMLVIFQLFCYVGVLADLM